jgi:CO/xanthine dehydrogenase Mo-binding subunit
MLTYEPNIVLSNKEYKVVGTRPIRPDGAEKVTGRARYGADVQLPGIAMRGSYPSIPATLRNSPACVR